MERSLLYSESLIQMSIISPFRLVFDLTTECYSLVKVIHKMNTGIFWGAKLENVTERTFEHHMARKGKGFPRHGN